MVVGPTIDVVREELCLKSRLYSFEEDHFWRNSFHLTRADFGCLFGVLAQMRLDSCFLRFL